ncbi:ABC transporter substrate-binding protein [Bacteroides sp. CG01]|uniref:ABC transporter substrate-binding protein n=1 Tax=Bacteroides sp. CG01 TaxID=3096000 RepID=UPI002AFF78F2|nr:ABC transporter substrate-binding protein [Bacteroides sp. CG01]
MKQIHLASGLLSLLTFFVIEVNAQSITITPKWTAQAQFAGYYVAEKMGFYKEEGLEVHIRHPFISESSFSFLDKGLAQAVVMNLSYALTERAMGGARVVNIMQTSQENNLMLVSRSPLKGISSLQHKKIAVWNHLSQKLLDQIARFYNLQVEWVRFNSGVNIFLSGAVDICLVGSFNEYPQLIECGMKIDSTCTLRFADYGYNLPEDGLYITEEFLYQHPEAVRKLVRASIRGWIWANEHREETLDIVMEQVHRCNVGTNRYHQRKMLEEVLRLQVDRRTGKRTYHLSREGFNCAVNHLLPEDVQKSNHISYEDFVK